MRRQVRWRSAPASLALGIALLTAGCVGSPGPSCGGDSVTIAATLPASGSLDPAALHACQDQHVALKIAAARDGTLHIHGYDDQDVETDLHAGASATLTFTAVHVGQFHVELHPLGSEEEGADIAILTVDAR